MALFRKSYPVMVLRHKDIDVVRGEYDPGRHAFRNARMIDSSHLPVGVYADGRQADLNSLNQWLASRAIPGYRVDLERLKRRLAFDDPMELLEEEYSLSVSDHYWLVPEGSEKRYSQMNFFERAFDQSGFANAMFRHTHYDPEESAKHTPNNTLGGYHRKAWMKQDGVLCLYKGSTGFHQQECINEWLASVLAEQLGMYCVPYDVTVYESQLVSICPNFLNLDLELVTAEDAIRSLGPNTRESYQTLIEAMERHGILDARKTMDEWLILDFLMMNTDRHSQNVGILKDANTNQWIAMAPIFDTGTSLGCFVKTSQLDTYDQEPKARFLARRNFSFNDLLGNVSSLSRFDLSALDEVPDLFRSVMVSYRSRTGISQERINALGNLLQRRIDRLKTIQTRVH